MTNHLTPTSYGYPIKRITFSLNYSIVTTLASILTPKHPFSRFKLASILSRKCPFFDFQTSVIFAEKLLQSDENSSACVFITSCGRHIFSIKITTSKHPFKLNMKQSHTSLVYVECPLVKRGMQAYSFSWVVFRAIVTKMATLLHIHEPVKLQKPTKLFRVSS